MSLSLNTVEPGEPAGTSKLTLARHYLSRLLDWAKEEVRLTYYAHMRWRAEKGNPMAQYIMGTLCEGGQGVFQTNSEAVKWYQKAAYQGVAPAQLAMGLRFLHGAGLPQNDSEAFLWLRKAAEQSEVDAEYQLGCMYLAARGTHRDLLQARKWLSRAAARGHQEAGQRLAELTASIPAAPAVPQQLAA